MYNLLIVAKFAPNNYQKKFQEAVKYWMKENPDYYLTNARDFNDLQMTMQLLTNPEITEGNFLYRHETLCFDGSICPTHT